ncbi:hypothetical protein [Clostridium estertheticum]|uniref:hypothetical protein n=1 Tax=Clostridium estertheticum TaxID=238834 RepID=UPI00227C7AA8|nr:hypothetical protein [Clostridium estertheticum]
MKLIRGDGGMPVIISKEEFQIDKEIMSARKKASGPNKAKGIDLLPGLFFCGECG